MMKMNFWILMHAEIPIVDNALGNEVSYSNDPTQLSVIKLSKLLCTSLIWKFSNEKVGTLILTRA